jgi:hypothetical protein
MKKQFQIMPFDHVVEIIEREHPRVHHGLGDSVFALNKNEGFSVLGQYKTHAISTYAYEDGSMVRTVILENLNNELKEKALEFFRVVK